MKSEQKVRWIDAGEVPALQSQAIYHALAYARNDQSPDTVVILRPGQPYVCLGYHQNAHTELNLDACEKAGLPVIRRETGGGTVFIDNMQLFVQWVFAPEHLPRRADTRFQYFIHPLVEAHRRLGVRAQFHPPNDVHVKGRKLVGTGAGSIGNAEVVTGNFLLAFDYSAMVSILHVPGACFREMFAESLQIYLSTLSKELGKTPAIGEIKRLYLEECEKCLQRPMEQGEFTAEEKRWIDSIAERFQSKEWLFQQPQAVKEQAQRLVKVHADVWVGQCNWKAPTGEELTAVLRLKGKRIDAIRFCNSVRMTPSYKLEAFEKMLKHIPFDLRSIEQAAEMFFELHDVRSDNLVPKDFARALVTLKNHNVAAPFAN